MISTSDICCIARVLASDVPTIDILEQSKYTINIRLQSSTLLFSLGCRFLCPTTVAITAQICNTARVLVLPLDPDPVHVVDFLAMLFSATLQSSSEVGYGS